MGRPKKNKDSSSEVKKEKTAKTTTAKTIGPYDIIKLMFTDIEGFNKLSNNMLERNAFIINRVFSIQFPGQAQYFNNTNIRTADVVKAWRLFAVKTLGFGKVPSFVYTKGSGKSVESKNKNEGITKELKESYCKHYQLTLKDYADTLEFFYDDLISDIKKYEHIISPKEQANAIQKEK